MYCRVYVLHHTEESFLSLVNLNWHHALVARGISGGAFIGALMMKRDDILSDRYHALMARGVSGGTLIGPS